MARLPISENVANRLLEIAKQMGGGRVEVGFMEDATYPDGTTVATAAYMDEFGHGGNFPAPPRPFFRTMIAKESPEWPTKMAAIAKAVDYDGAKVLAYMGEDIEGALKQSIINTNDPPLSETTLRLRAKFGNNPQEIRAGDVVDAQKSTNADGSLKEIASGTQAKPLVWTGHMLNSTAYKVFK